MTCSDCQGSVLIYLRTFQGLCVESESTELEYGDAVLGCDGSVTSLTPAGGQSSERGSWSRLPGGSSRFAGRSFRSSGRPRRVSSARA